MVSFEDVRGGNGSNRSLFHQYEHEDNGDDDLDEYFHQPGKKRRLTVDQVQFLEKSFDMENKLEPERKILLAKDLGLQPRQVAIWFQNRRARWKNKQLEKDYEALQANYNSLKADCESLAKENEKLKAEVDANVIHCLLFNLYYFPFEFYMISLNCLSGSCSLGKAAPQREREWNLRTL